MKEKEERVFSFCNIRNYASVCFLNIFIKGLGYTLITSYFSYFYTVFLGVPAAAVAAVLGIGIILDGVSDFAMGAVIDMIHTKYGKAKHWLLFMAVPLGLSMGLIFMIPQDASVAVKIVWGFIAYNLYCCCMTAVRIPSQSMASLASDNDKVRTIYGWCSSAGSTLAMTVTAAVLVPCIQYFGNGKESAYAYKMTLIVFSALTAAAVLLSGILFHEKRQGDYWKEVKERTAEETGKHKAFQGCKKIIHNKYWIIYFLFHFFESWVPGIFSGTLAYFCAFVLGDPAAASILLAATSLPQLLGQFVILPMMRFMDTVKVGLIGNIIVVLGCVIGKLFGISSIELLCVGLAIRYFGMGMMNGCRGGILPRIVDYGEWKYGLRQDGMVQGGNSVLDKITSALITVILGAVLSATGFSETNVSALTVGWIQFIFLDLSLIFACLSLGTYLFFDLPQEKVSKMREEIHEREMKTISFWGKTEMKESSCV